jgi:uncharacterized protein YukE
MQGQRRGERIMGPAGGRGGTIKVQPEDLAAAQSQVQRVFEELRSVLAAVRAVSACTASITDPGAAVSFDRMQALWIRQVEATAYDIDEIGAELGGACVAYPFTDQAAMR